MNALFLFRDATCLPFEYSLSTLLAFHMGQPSLKASFKIGGSRSSALLVPWKKRSEGQCIAD